MNKLDMNLFAFVAWLQQNRQAHSISGLTIDDGYEWYNHMWNQWLRNSDAGRTMTMYKQETPLDKLFKVSSIELDQEINNLLQENLFNLLHDEESKEETIETVFVKDEVLELMCKAFETGYKKYEVVEAGLEGLETETECNWIFEKYNKI
jgi:hypothetical protein